MKVTRYDQEVDENLVSVPAGEVFVCVHVSPDCVFMRMNGSGNAANSPSAVRLSDGEAFFFGLDTLVLRKKGSSVSVCAK